MKRLLLLLPVMLFFVGCKDLLHDEEISMGKIESYEQLVEATGGVYGRLAEFLYEPGFYSMNLNGDDMNVDEAIYPPSAAISFCYKARDYGGGGGSWEYIHAVIISANNIINQYNPSLIKDLPTREILGEIYLLRAYCYFRLTRCYGNVPIIDNIDINYSVKKSSYIQIYSFIEGDLKMAMDLLPKSSNLARVPYVTPHRGSAKAILAEVYLSWAGYPCKDGSKYALAAKEAGETIDSSGYFGLRLLDDFAFLWDYAHLYNPESVFSLYCSNPLPLPQEVDKSGGWKGFYFGAVEDIDFGRRSNVPLGNISIYNNFWPAEVNFYNNFPAGYRKEITFYTTFYYNYNQYDVFGNLLHADSGYAHIDKIDPCCRVAYRKFYYDARETIQTVSVPGPTDSALHSYYFGLPRVFIFRYAQTVLTYAEAMARSGQLNNSAYEYVNKIRRRAQHLDLNSPSVYDLPVGLSAGAFADSVVQERAWELCGEPEGRWFDLVRLEMVEDLPKIRYSAEGGPPSKFDKSAYFSSIPNAEKILDPNLEK